MKRNPLLVILAAVGMILMGMTFVGSVSAAPGTLHRPFPQGIDPNNAGKAFNQIMQRATADPSYAGQLASSAGASGFVAGDWRADGYGRVTGGVNSGVTAAGSTVATRDTVTCRKGARAFKVRNIKTGKTVEICVGCGNPRLQQPPRSLPTHRWAKGTVLKLNKKLTINKTIVCPATGQQVKATATFWVRGRITGRTWGIVQGRMQAKLRVATNLKLQGILKLKCGTVTPPVTPPPPSPPQPPAPVPCPPGTIGIHPACVPAQNTVSAVATATASANVRVSCPNGTVVTVKVYGYGEGQASAGTLEEAKAKAQKIADDNAAVALARAKADVEVDVVCGSNPPPPPPPVDRAPQIALTALPAHLIVNRNVDGYVEASDPDGDALSVNVVGTGAGHVSGVVPSSIRWDGSPCPSTVKCYRFTIWSGASAGTINITATVSAGGKSTPVTGSIPVDRKSVV